MHIAIVTPYFPPDPGAAAIRVRTFMHTLEQAGHTVSVISLNKKNATHSEKVTRLRSSISLHPQQYRTFQKELQLTLAEVQPDICIVSAPPHLLAWHVAQAAAALNIAYITDVRDYYRVAKKTHLQRFIFSTLLKRVYGQARHIITTTDTHKQLLIDEFTLPESSITPIYNGAYIPPSLDQEKKSIDIAFIGSLNPERNLAGIQKTIEKILELRPTSSIRFIGADTKQVWVAEFIEELSKKTRKAQIEILSEVDHETALQLLAEARIGLIAVSDDPLLDYQLPVKVFDYMTVGIPVLALTPNRSTELNSFIETEGIGFHTDSSDELAKQIIHLLSDPKHLQHYNTHNTALAHMYNRYTTAQLILDLLNEV